jgi:hypothetical protein
MSKLIFYNNFHNGDIHFTREFVKDIMRKTSYDEYYFLHKRSPKLLMDIPNLKYGPLNEKCNQDCPYSVINDETYINTHLGVYEMFVEKVNDVSLYVFYDYFQIIYNRLRIPMERKRYYIPSINYNSYEINGIKEYIGSNRLQNKILICNGDVHSNQSYSVDFKKLIEKLSTDYPNYHFIMTDKRDYEERNNLFYTRDIIKTDSDLNEISYLSTFCDIIIGRASGPYSFCEVKDNMNDVDKTFVFICNVFSDGMWYDRTLCNKVWINNYDYNNIYEVVKSQIDKLNFYNNIVDVSSSDNKINISSIAHTPKLRIEFFKEKELLYKYVCNLEPGITHWCTPHGHYYTGMEVKCRFYLDETNEYLFQKII